MSRLQGHRFPPLILCLLLAWAWLLGAPSAARAADAAPQISQYAHTSWTARDGAQLGLVFAFAQTHDGYLWVGGSYGLFRFDGLRFVPWQPPKGSSLPSNPYALLVSRDGTLWIGTFNGLVSWNGSRLTRYPETDGGLVTSLLEDSEGTVWAGGTKPAHWTATLFQGPKKNFVFNAATIFWSQGLSSPPGHMLPWSHWSRPHGPDERVQKITHNLLQRILA